MLRVNGKTIALSTSCSLNTTTQTVEARTKDDATGPAAEFDYVDWTASSENMVGMNETTTGQMLYDELLALQIAGTKVEVSLALMQNAAGTVPSNDWQPETATGSGFAPYHGFALIESLNLNAPVDGNATVSVNFKAAGPLSKVTAQSTGS